MKRLASSIDFVAVNRAALSALPALVQRWLRDGRREGNEWVARNRREPIGGRAYSRSTCARDAGRTSPPTSGAAMRSASPRTCMASPSSRQRASSPRCSVSMEIGRDAPRRRTVRAAWRG